MKKAVSVLAFVLMLALAGQLVLAAIGAFTTMPREESFAPHRMLGNGILLLAIVITITAAVARMPGKLIGAAGLVAALVLVQSLIKEIAAAIGDGTTAGHLFFGLHAVNALAIIGVTEFVVRRSRQLASKTAEPERIAS